MNKTDTSKLFEEAEKAYRATEDHCQSGDMEAVREALASAKEALSKCKMILNEQEENWPEGFAGLYNCTAIAYEAVSSSADQGLLKIKEAIHFQGSDPTLEALQERLEAQVRDLIPELKEQMRTAMEAGNTTKALDLARQIRDLQPGDTEFARTFNRLQRRQQLEDKINTTNKDYESKLSSNSLPDAVKALEDGLDAFLDPEIEWPEEARETLFELRELKSNPLAFGDEAVWEQVQQLLSTLGRQGLESWVARQAQQMATQWAELARDVALKGVVASAAELGNLLQSYRAASEYLKDHTQDEDAIEQLAAAEEKLINQLNSSATKRISRAQEALHDGEFAIALRNLDSLDDDIYGPVDAEFPGLLDKHNEVDQTRREAERLQAEAARLQALDEEVRPKLETAQQVFAEDNLEAAEQALKELPDLSPIPGLKQRAEDLRVKISDARVEHTREALSNLMNRVQTGLRLSTKPEQLDTYVQEMEALQSEIDLDLLASVKREAYYQLLDKVRVLREELVSGQHWAQEAEKAIEEDRYSDAEEALEEARKVTRDAKKKIALQQRIRRIEKRAQKQREREEAQEEGEDLFYERRYDEARTWLERAQGLGADVGEMLRAARAGTLWQKAQHIWQERQNWKIALSSLRRANNLLKDNPFAEDISMEIEILQEELENARVQAEESSKKQDKLARLIAEARRWLADGDLEQAQRQIQDALTIDGNAQEVLDLQNQIRQQWEARSWVEKARKAYQSEKFKEALGFVETALTLAPGYPQAKHLKGKIEDERKAQQDLVRVMVLARSDKFTEARERLHELSQQRVDPERVMETQQEVERLEQAWWRKNITPIEEAQRAGNYQEALDKCNEVMPRLASEDYKTQLENRQQQIVNDWAERVLGQTQPQLQEDASEAQLQEAIIEIEQVLNLEPAPTKWLRQLQDALKTTHTLRLRAQLRKAKEHDKEGAYENALAVVQQVKEKLNALEDDIDVALRFEINDLEQDIQRQRESEEKQRKGESLFYKQAYNRAQVQLEQAKQLGADVNEMLQAARAGELWLEVKGGWKEHQNWRVTLDKLRRITNSLQGNSFAENILSEIEILREEAEEARSQTRRKLIASGTAYLEEGAYDQAREEFKQAKQHGFDVHRFLEAVEAGRRLECGREALEMGEVGRAELHLIRAVKLGQKSSLARDIVREARRLLHKLQLERAQSIMEKAKQEANDLLLEKASRLIEEVEDILEQLQKEEAAFEPTDLQVLRVEMPYYREVIEKGLMLLRKVGEAQIYLERNSNSKEAQAILSEVIESDDGGEDILKVIKRKAKAVRIREGVRKKDYQKLREGIIGRIDGSPSQEDLQALREIEALEDLQDRKKARDQNLQDRKQTLEQALKIRQQAWEEMREQQSNYFQETQKQLKKDRRKVDEDLKYWKKISGITSVALVALTVGAIVFVIISRKPLATLSALPAILVGIVEPIVLSRYNKALERAADKSSDVVTQINEYQKEQNARFGEIFESILGDIQSLSPTQENDHFPEFDEDIKPETGGGSNDS